MQKQQQNDADIPELHEYTQADLLKLIRVYEPRYSDCEDERIIVKKLNTTLTKKDVDSLLKDEDYKVTQQFMVFFCNYVINYCNLVKRTPPYFVILTCKEDNPNFSNILLYSGAELNQAQMGKFKYNKTTDKIVILIGMPEKWILVYINNQQGYIIDYQFTSKTKLDKFVQFTNQFIEQNLGIRNVEIHDYMVDVFQSGDCGDLQCYLSYKIFISNQPIQEDEPLSKNEIAVAKRRLLWLSLKMMKEREKKDDDAVQLKRMRQVQEIEFIRQKEEELEKQKDAISRFEEKKSTVYGFLEQEPPEAVMEEDDIITKLLKEKLSQFNASRAVSNMEQFLKRKKANKEYNYNYPTEIKQYIPPKKDLKARVKVILPRQPNSQTNQLQPVQWNTPESYRIAEIFNSQPLIPQPPAVRRVIDLRLIDDNEQKKLQFMKSLEPQPVSSGFFGSIGSRLFDYNDYRLDKIEPKQQQVQYVQKVRPKLIDKVNTEIQKQEQFLLQF